ncbi:type VI secretion system tip protein VgrG [Belliella sp. DSM 107340]|uniref:Type VI secretion system tip protein VgrG n=1 Tax=Belliella calami TaxID=2923436 RepID=A0ABS9URD2_9BACT|nr:type VI secretion system tip protein VgrG [Belliella calami]MCH7399183.1 type VI secretion system tip protein VgrG [Belliella calami]
MSNSETINTSRSADLVTVTVAIDGTELSSVFQLLNVTVHKEVNRIPMAKLIFSDGDPAMRDFELSNMQEMMPGKQIEISAGYHKDEAVIFKGIIIKHQIKVKGTSSLLIVECKDQAVKLTVGKKSKTFHDMSDSDAIEAILSNYSLTSEVASTNFSNKKLVQYDSTDWDFLVSRAQACGKLCFVSDGEIKVSAPDVDADIIQKVTYGANILDFDAEMDARNQFKKITAQTWDGPRQEIIEVEKELENLSLHGNFSNSDLANVIGLEKLELKNGGNIPDELLQDWTEATMLYQSLSKVRGRVKFQGIPDVLPNTCIELEGLGERFSGKAWVSGVFHQINDGNWTVDVQFGLNPEWFSETYPIHSSPASSLLPAVKGLQIGLVSQLEDPDGEDKILVKIPIINAEDEGVWCRVSSLDAGESRGVFFRPEIGDEVVVGFLNEDPNQPIVLGGLHSSAKPAPITANDDNHEKGIITRSELKITFNDETKAITIESPGGKKIILDEDAQNISIEDENNNQIILDADGIQIISGKDLQIKASGDINIEGTNVTGKASAQLTVEGSGGAEISSSASTVVKGSIVQIN